MWRIGFTWLIVIFFASCGNTKNTGRYISETDTAFSKDIRDISAKINKDPRNAQLYYNRGNTFYYQDKFRDAVLDLETAVGLDSTNAVYHYLLGETLLKMDTADSRKAKMHLERSLQLKEDFPDAMLALGTLYLARQDYSKAETLFKKLAIKPDMAAKANVFMGICKKEQKDTLRALQYFEKAQESDPSNYDAAIQTALIKSAQNDPNTLKYFDKVIALNEYSDEAFYGKGLWLQKHEKYKDALANYEKVRTLNPGHILGLYNTAVIYNLFEEYAKAAEMCNKVLDLNPKNANALALRGYTYEKRGNKKAALQDYKEALQLDPKNAPAEAGVREIEGK
ncbi:MAG: tetratricopeptide repeat protein [Bacteroidetes bacterium]|nr:tetratricopeptide repeat protein [Bacteroidota bacterium]